MATDNTARLGNPLALIEQNIEVAIGLVVVGILMLMILPLPSILLDLLLSLNITISLVILLIAMYIQQPLELSAFPSILLILTLFRLSLNISSTRLVLLHGHEGIDAAGKVIMAFGNFVVGGNYVVGAIIFLILVVINFMVITKGATRIAEVAARFTLDAMPGKQMSIDADLNAGYITEEEAKERRLKLSREAEYYGSMDGANKFVRGDAVAGIIITLINIVGGFVIGVFLNGMPFGEAARSYTLLTVGDGLVTQIPALIVSTSAGIIVARSGSEASMGAEIAGQIFRQPLAIGVAAFILFGFGLIPGLPTIPFFVLSAIAGLLSYFLFQAERERVEKADAEKREAAEAPRPPSMETLPPLDILALEIGHGLITLVDSEQDGQLLERIRSIRKQIADEIGIIVPPVHIQDNMQFKPGEYAILLKGNQIARHELMPGYLLAMHIGAAPEKIAGIKTQEPTYGLPAYWIKESAREQALSKGYTVVDLPTVLITQLSELIRRHAHELLGRQEVRKMLDHIKESHPSVVDELVPGLLPLGAVVRILQHLLKEQVPIRDLLSILETLADWAPMVKDVDTLTEYVRQSMSRTITRLYQNAEGSLPIITVSQRVEQTILGGVQKSDHGGFLGLDPNMAQKIVEKAAEQIERFASLNQQPVLVCSAPVRIHMKRLLDQFMPHQAVLSYNEISGTVRVQSLGTLEIPNAN